MKRQLIALGVAALVAAPLSACSDTSSSGSDLRAESTPAASPTASARADLGGMALQAHQLAQALPQFAALTETPSATESVDTGAASLDSCAKVSPELLEQDFGITLTTAAMPEPSSYEDPEATDCLYGDSASLIAVEATTRADQDVPADSNDVSMLPNTATIPGADRGYVWIPDPTATSGAAAVFVVVGQLALNVLVTTAAPITIDQATTFGQDLVTALSS